MPNISNYVGIDMAKNDFYACLDEIMEPRKFNNDTKGIKSFFSHLKRCDFKKDNTTIGVESTASYHLKLCVAAANSDYKIKVINPLIVKKQNQTDLRRVKNDKKDSKLIRFCLVGGAGYLFDNDSEAIVLKSLIRQRDSLVSAKLRFARQQEDIRLKEKCLKQDISPVYTEIINVLEEKIDLLKADLRLYRPKEQYLLESIPGIGPITAASFISEVGDIKRFKKPEQLVAYAGLDPRVHQSGISINGKGFISKRGNKILRTRLFNAASVAVQRDNLFKSFFQKRRVKVNPTGLRWSPP